MQSNTYTHSLSLSLSLQQIDSADPNVREAAFESIATLLKVVGERPMNMYIETIDKNKMTKVSCLNSSVGKDLRNRFPTADPGAQGESGVKNKSWSHLQPHDQAKGSCQNKRMCTNTTPSCDSHMT